MQAETDGRLLSVLILLLKMFFRGKQVDAYLSVPRKNDKK
jgi:hypothetical protein